MAAGTGSCGGNCNHVWHYAQAYARLFPALGRIMRGQDYRYPLPDGGLPFRQPSRGVDPGRRSFPATDGQLGVILASYREYLTDTDHTWLRAQWPSIRRAMQFVIDTWDADGDGALNGIQHTTLDCKVGGSTSWLGSLYLAALRACEEMARTAGDESRAERYRRLHRSGARIQDRTLFNGAYYIQRIEGTPEDLRDYYTEKGYRDEKHMHPAFIGGQNYFNGCQIDQLLGQWWANQLDLGWLYPEEHVRTALKSLFEHNYLPTHAGYEPRRVPKVDPDDGGMVFLTFPRGRDERLRGKKILGYWACTLPGFEYAAAAAMLQAGLVREAFTVVRTVSDRYDGRMRTGLHRKTTWGWSGNPFGDDECGKWGARAQSAWSLLLAAQGYRYDGPDGIIGFDPVWKPGDHRSFFTAATGFGVFSQERSGTTQTNIVEMRDGVLKVRRIVLYLPAAIPLAAVSVERAGRSVSADTQTRERRVELTFHEPVLLSGRETLQVKLSW
jgi:hypothetical protein